MNEIQNYEEQELTFDEINAEIGTMLREILSPVLESMARFMAQSSEALERVAAQQKVQSDRMEALEKQIRLNTLVTPTQVKYMNDAAKARAREILEKKELADDRKAVNSLTAMIRKSVLARYGVAALHEIPKHEYPIAMQAISGYNDLIAVRDIVKEARKRAQETMDSAE